MTESASVTQTRESFQFYTRLNLTELTGLRAATLRQLAAQIKRVPGSSIYHHTHRFLQQHQYLQPEPPNDFAFWVTNVLGEDELGERLASIDVMQYSTLRELRERLAEVIESYLEENPRARRRFADPNDEFHFMKSITFILPTCFTVNDLRGFAEGLKKVAADSIYFHMLEARLRLGKETNDFSNWIDTSLGHQDLAARIAGLDPYSTTLEGLRHSLIRLVERELTH